MIRRGAAAGAIALATIVLGVLVGAAPAGAVPLRPTDVRSSVTGVEPAGAPLSARILGGDMLVDLEVQPGHEVVVLGYDREPYLRIRTDGAVEQNQRSPAVGLNRSRDAGSTEASADAAAPPDWVRVGEGGRTTWHDHRIHSMASLAVDSPQSWTIPLQVDGTEGALLGELVRVAAPTWWPWLLVVGVATGAFLAVGWRRAAPVSRWLILGSATLALVAGGFDRAAITHPGDRPAALVLFPGLAVVLGVVAGSVGRRWSTIVSAAALALLAGWVAVQWPVLTMPVVTSGLPVALDRLVIAVVLGGTIAAAGLMLVAAGEDARSDPIAGPSANRS